MRITALAEAEHQPSPTRLSTKKATWGNRIGPKQIQIIKQQDEPTVVIMEMSPLDIWILQNRILAGYKQVNNLCKYIHNTWKPIRKDLIKLAIKGKIYLMSYDMVQIFTGNYVKNVKEYFGINLPNPWDHLPGVYKSDKKKKVILSKAIDRFKSLRQKDYDNQYNEIHQYIFKQIINHIKISYKICSGNVSENYWLNYMISRDTIGADYVAKLLNKFEPDNVIIICHAVHAYYIPKKPHFSTKTSSKPHESVMVYSNDLKPFVNNLQAKLCYAVAKVFINTLLIDKGHKYPPTINGTKCLEYYLLNSDPKDWNKKTFKKQQFILQEANIYLYGYQFDEYIIC